MGATSPGSASPGGSAATVGSGGGAGAGAGAGASGTGTGAAPTIYDNVGAGASTLDFILRSRVDAAGVVGKTVTRLLFVGKMARGASQQEVADVQAQCLSETDTDVTGACRRRRCYGVQLHDGLHISIC